MTSVPGDKPRDDQQNMDQKNEQVSAKDSASSKTKNTQKPLPNASQAIDHRLQQCPKDAHHPITVLAKHRIREGCEDDFDAWVEEITTFQNQKCPGYLGSEVIRPMNCEYKNEYISIFRYDTYENLSHWMNSKDREERIEKVQAFLEVPLLVTYHSLEHWFVRPADADHDGTSSVASAKPIKAQGPPPNYKMVVVVFLVIWFQIHFILPYTIGKINGLSPLGKEGVGTLLVVILTTYVFMPFATRVLAFWLFPGADYLAMLKQLLPTPLLRAMEHNNKDGATKHVSISMDEESEREGDQKVATAV